MTKIRTSKELIAEAADDSNFWNIHDKLKGLDIEQIREVQKEVTLPFAVCVLNLTGDLNVGMITRTACIFGAQEVIIFGRRKYDKRSTVGAQNYVTITRIDGFENNWSQEFSLEKFREMCKEKNLFPVFVEQNGRDIRDIGWMDWLDGLYATEDEDGTEILWKTPCLVLGNENEGVPEEFLEIGTVISIHQRGVIRSLNVSAAAAIAIHYFSNAIAMCENAKRDIAEHFGRDK